MAKRSKKKNKRKKTRSKKRSKKKKKSKKKIKSSQSKVVRSKKSIIVNFVYGEAVTKEFKQRFDKFLSSIEYF